MLNWCIFNFGHGLSPFGPVLSILEGFLGLVAWIRRDVDMVELGFVEFFTELGTNFEMEIAFFSLFLTVPGREPASCE